MCVSLHILGEISLAYIPRSNITAFFQRALQNGWLSCLSLYKQLTLELSGLNSKFLLLSHWFHGSGIRNCFSGWFWLRWSSEVAVKTLTRITTIRRYTWGYGIHSQDGTHVAVHSILGGLSRGLLGCSYDRTARFPQQVFQDTGGGRFYELVSEIQRCRSQSLSTHSIH